MKPVITAQTQDPGKENHPDMIASINTQIIEEVSEDCSSNNNYSYLQGNDLYPPVLRTSSKQARAQY